MKLRRLEEETLELIRGVKVRVKPLTTPIILAALHEAEDARMSGTWLDRFTRAVAKRVIVAWDGVYDETGKLADLTEQNIDALMDLWPVFAAFQEKYIHKWGELEEEKKE